MRGKKKTSKKKKVQKDPIDREKWANEFQGHWKNLSGELVSEMRNSQEFGSLFPTVQRVFAKTVEFDIVEVKPMSGPAGILQYMDTEIIYTDEEQIERDPVKWMRKNIEWVNVK